MHPFGLELSFFHSLSKFSSFSEQLKLDIGSNLRRDEIQWMFTSFFLTFQSSALSGISINLTKHNEKSMLEAVNGEDMRASSEISLLFYREIALGRAVVVDPLQVGLIWVLMRQKCLESE